MTWCQKNTARQPSTPLGYWGDTWVTANTVASRKAKGRKAAQAARDAILKAAGTRLLPADVHVTSSSVCGEDLTLSPRAFDYLPVSVEVKCQERLNFWEAIKQNEENCACPSIQPIVVFKRNHEKLRVIVDFEYFLHLHFDGAR